MSDNENMQRVRRRRGRWGMTTSLAFLSLLAVTACADRSVGRIGDAATEDAGITSGRDAAPDAVITGSDATPACVGLVYTGDGGMPPCPPGQSRCPEGCVELQHDESNCGACGYSCGDLSCYTGRCSCFSAGPTVCPGAYDDCYEDNGTIETARSLSLGTTSLHLCFGTYAFPWRDEDHFLLPPCARYRSRSVTSTVDPMLFIPSSLGLRFDNARVGLS